MPAPVPDGAVWVGTPGFTPVWTPAQWPGVVRGLERISRVGGIPLNDPSACVDRAMGRYLVGLVTPPRGSRCASDRLPFDPAFGTPVS